MLFSLAKIIKISSHTNRVKKNQCRDIPDTDLIFYVTAIYFSKNQIYLSPVHLSADPAYTQGRIFLEEYR